MDMKEWAVREVALACKKENPNRKDSEFDYGCACYESALKAFESLLGDGHSGFSIKMTQSILNRLIDNIPLTPIEDTKDVWDRRSCLDEDNTYICYQCNRMSSLFKQVYTNGTVKYSNVDLCYCVDINNPNIDWSNRQVCEIIEEYFPITMPYMPGKPIKVYVEEFLVDSKNGDYDTIGILYCLKEENGEQKRVEINRFFKESEDSATGGWIEISEEEYQERKAKKIK